MGSLLNRKLRPDWLRAHSLHLRAEEIAFWTILAALNTLLFLPSNLLDAGAGFAGDVHELADIVREFWDALLHGRGGKSLQISAELVVLAAVWTYSGRLRGGMTKWSAILVYLLFLLYQVYEGVIVSLYGVPANMYANLLMARDGLPFLFSNLQISVLTYLLSGLLVILFISVIYLMIKGLYDLCSRDSLGRSTRVAIATLAGTAVFGVVLYQPAYADQEMLVDSAVLRIQRNIRSSIELQRSLGEFDATEQTNSAEFGHYEIDNRPDVYLIFIESYGSVLLRRPDFELAYKGLLNELEHLLEEGGWRTASTMSTSPTWGGGSWIAYTSALFGRRIDSHPHYLRLLEKYGGTEADYPGLPRVLGEEGYSTYWLSPIAKELDDEEWEQYRRFYAIDNWLRRRDFAYEGREYGWGPAPPDQFVLEYARAKHLDTAGGPIFVMFITQNSHFPYETAPIVDDWRTLNLPVDETSEDEELTHDELRAAYMNSIEYELRVLTRFILDTEDEDTLFILVGDHQPPRVSRRDDTFDTPLHVIMRDPSSIDRLVADGLKRGLLPNEHNDKMSHEEIYGLVMDLLQETE